MKFNRSDIESLFASAGLSSAHHIVLGKLLDEVYPVKKIKTPVRSFEKGLETVKNFAVANLKIQAIKESRAIANNDGSYADFVLKTLRANRQPYSTDARGLGEHKNFVELIIAGRVQ